MLLLIDINKVNTVSKIVEYIFEHIDDVTFRREFNRLKFSLVSTILKYDALILGSMSSKLVKYSWFDLVLLEYVLEIRVLDMDNVTSLSLVNIEHIMLQCSVIRLSFLDMSYQKMLNVKQTREDIEIILKNKYDSLLSTNKYTIPTTRLEHIEAVERIDQSSLELEDESSDNITRSYDIDGYSVCIYEFKSGDFKSNLHLKFDINNLQHIYSKKMYCEKRKVLLKELFNFKIGEITSHLGRTSVYLVSYEIISDLQALINQVYISAGKNSIDSSTIDVDLGVHLIHSFFSSFFSVYENMFIFIEGYGSKKHYCDVSFSIVYKSLKNVFSEKIILDMHIDIGATLKSNSNRIIFLKKSGFEKLSLIPNYNLFFCNSMSNYHKRFTSMSSGVMHHAYGPISKVNFYSLTEDIFSNIRKISFMPEISLNIVKNNFYDYVYCNRHLRDYDDMYSTVLKRLETEVNIGYRLEVKTLGAFVPIVFNIVQGLIEGNNWCSMDYSLFRDILTTNISGMKSTIRGNTIYDLGRNIIIETILKEFYIKGSCNKHFLTDSLLSQITDMYSYKSISLINVLERLSITDNDITTITRKVIDLSEDRLDNFFKTIIRSFLHIYGSNNSIYCARLLIVQYIADFKKFFGLTEDIQMNYNSLNNRDNYVDIKEGSTSLVHYLERDFLGEVSRSNNLSYYFMSSFLMEKFGMARNELLDIVYTVFRSHGMNLCFKMVHNKYQGKVLQVLNLGVNQVSSINKKSVLSRLDTEVSNYLGITNKISLKNKREVWSDEEKVRLMHGLLRYSNSSARWSLIRTDFVYGFYLSRIVHNAVYDAFKNMKRINSIYRYVLLALTWSNQDYPLDDHYSFLGLNDVESESIRSLYNELYQYDLCNYTEISTDQLEYFYNTFLDKKYITQEEYNNLRRVLETQLRTSFSQNEFLSATYVPITLEAEHQDIIIISRPAVVARNVQREETATEITTNDIPSEQRMSLEDRVAYLENKIAYIEELLHTRNATHSENNIPTVEEENTSFNHDDFFEPGDYSTINDVVDPMSVRDSTVVSQGILSLEQDNVNLVESNLDATYIDLVKTKIRRKYSGKKFTASASRTLLFDSRQRPSINEWSDTLDYLCSIRYLTAHESMYNGNPVKQYRISKK